MPKITDEQNYPALLKGIAEFNKRASWIDELVEKNQDFKINQTMSQVFGKQIDTRDYYAMSTLLPLRGESEEERKKNFQDDIIRMNNAFMKGPSEEAYKYIDMVIKANMEYDEDKLDLSKDEDAFKAVSWGALGQCVGTKRQEFEAHFNDVINTDEKKEEFFYRNAYFSYVSTSVMGVINKIGPINNKVSIFSAEDQMDVYSKKNNENIVKRDLEQYENYKQGKKETIPLEFVLSPHYSKAEDTSLSAKKIAGDMDIYISVELGMGEVFLPGGTEGKLRLDMNHYSWKEAVFIDGRPLKEVMEHSLTNSKEGSFEEKMISELARKMADPEANIEVLKLIPATNGNYKRVYVPVHRDFSSLNPALQAKHDAAFEKFVKETAPSYKEKENAFTDDIFDHIKDHDTAEEILRLQEEIPLLKKVGTKAAWNNFDPVIPDSENASRSMEHLNKTFGLLNKYEDLLVMVDHGYVKGSMGKIEDRQANQMCAFLVGPHGSDRDLIYTRHRIHMAFVRGGDELNSLYKELIFKIHNTDPLSFAMSKEDGLYNYVTFLNAMSSVTNIFEADKDLEAELCADKDLANDIALKVQMGAEGQPDMAYRIVQKYGHIQPNIYSKVDLSKDAVMNTQDLLGAETCRLGYDLIKGKMAVLYKGASAGRLHLPYFFSGNACGGNVEKFSSAKSTYDFNDFFNALEENDDGSLSIPSTPLDQADIIDLVVGTGNQFRAKLDYAYSTENMSVMNEFAKANAMDVNDLGGKFTYINGRSLEDIRNEKMSRYCEERNINLATASSFLKSSIARGMDACILGEALYAPDKVITQVFLDHDKNNVIVPRTVVMKKDYSAMIKSAANQHSKVSQFFHSLHMHKYAEEKLQDYAETAEKNFLKKGKNNLVCESFKEKFAAELLKHQGHYALNTELRKEALRVVSPEEYAKLSSQKEIIRNTRTYFGEQVISEENKAKTYDDPSSRMEIEHLTVFEKKISEVEDAHYLEGMQKTSGKVEVEVEEEKDGEFEPMSVSSKKNSVLENALEDEPKI